MISNQFTYNDIKKPVKREEMLSNDISSIGTQSGGFGSFKEQARVLTLQGAENILDELQVDAGLNLEKLFKICPTLKTLLNNTSYDKHPSDCKGCPDCQGINCKITNDALKDEFESSGDSKNQLDLLKG